MSRGLVILIMGILFLGTGCSTGEEDRAQLSQDLHNTESQLRKMDDLGQQLKSNDTPEITIVQNLEDISPTCSAIAGGQTLDEYEALKMGATHILASSPISNEGIAYKCPNTTAMTPEKLIPICNSGIANACVDLAFKTRNDWPAGKRLIYFDKGCKLGNNISCKIAQEIQKKLDFDNKLKKMKSECLNKNSAKSCSFVASLLYQENDLESAKNFAQRSCGLGNLAGCNMEQNISSEQLKREELKLKQKQIDQERAIAEKQREDTERQRQEENIERMNEYNNMQRQQEYEQIMQGASMMGRGMAHITDGGNPIQNNYQPQVYKMPVINVQAPPPSYSGTCGYRPMPAGPGCTVGRCVNGQWEQICN